MNFLKSWVDNFHPKTPLKFTNNDGESTTMEQMITKAAPELSKGYSFWVNPLLSSGHTQTLYTAVNQFETIDKVWYKREIITVEDKTYTIKDGDREVELKYDDWKGVSTFAIDYASSESEHDPDHLQYKPEHQTSKVPPRTEYIKPGKEMFPDDSKPLLIALHGLSGGSYESYVRSLINEVTSPEVGFDALVVTSRGCARHTITSPQLFCGLWTNDLRYFVNEYVKSRWPNKKVFLIGFSLGGAIVANYIGQEKDEIYDQIKGAFIVGAPWDFTDGTHVLRESLLGDRLYSPTMCQNLLKLLNRHSEGELKANEFISRFKENPEKYQMKTLRDFDDNFTSKLFGMNTSMEYYRHASPVQRLFKIRVPTVILNAQDDPVVGFRSVPTSEAPLNPYTSVVTTTIGGHLGWFDVKHNRWYSKPVAKLMKEMANWEKTTDDIVLPLDADNVWRYDRLYY